MAEGFFWGNDPNVNQELRRRIALQMMSQRKAFPKNIGEGLTAIGDTIGDLGIMHRLEQGDLAQQNAAKAAAAGLTSGDTSQRSETDTPPVRTAYADPGDIQAVADRSIAPAVAQTPVAAASLTPEEQAAGVVGSGANALDAAGAVDPWGARSRAIAGIESGGAKDPYSTLSVPTRGDRAYGKYQVMGANVPEWTKAATGTALTPQQFLANKAAQEATFRNQFGKYVDKYGDQGAARAWFGGEGGMNNLGATDNYGRLNVGQYGQDYMNRFNAGGGRDAIAAQLVAQQAAPGGPQPNPTLAGAGPSAALPLSSSAIAPGGADLPPEILTGASAIRAAPPPPPQIQAAPPPVQVAQAPGEYVMPRPEPPAPPPQVPLSPLGQKALAVIRANPNNEYIINGTIGDTLKTEMARQQTQQTQLNEDYKARLQNHNAMVLKYQDWLAAGEERAQKRTKAPYETSKLAAETAKAEAEAAAGKVPTTREIGGEVQQYDPVSKTWIKPPGATGSSAPNLSEDQAKNLGYYQRGKRALADLGTGSELNNFLEWHASGMPLVGNYLASTKFQEQYNAAREFAAIVLRRESGAAVTPKETEDVINRYIAKPGTTPETAIQKQYMREGVMSAIRDALGKATPLADRFDKTFEDEHARLETAKAAAGGKTVTPTDLPPVTITSKEEKDALPIGRHYTLPGDKPGEFRIKK